MGDVVLRELIMGAQDYDAMREGESQRAPQSVTSTLHVIKFSCLPSWTTTTTIIITVAPASLSILSFPSIFVHKER